MEKWNLKEDFGSVFALLWELLQSCMDLVRREAVIESIGGELRAFYSFMNEVKHLKGSRTLGGVVRLLRIRWRLSLTKETSISPPPVAPQQQETLGSFRS